MQSVASHIELIGHEPMAVEFPLGECVLAHTSGLFEIYIPRIPIRCYAVLTSWLPESAPVGMFVSYFEGETKRVVHSVYASPEFRGTVDNQKATNPVVVGTWLFETARLTEHSPDRTAAGDRWARAVGGKLPARHQIGSDRDASQSGQAGLARLNEVSWPDATLSAFLS